MTDSHSERVATQAWEYITRTGRISGEGEAIATADGIENFLQRAAEEWEAAGQPDFIAGMQRIMIGMIWN